MKLREISFRDAVDVAITGMRKVYVTMPSPIGKLQLDEIVRLDAAGAKFLVEEPEEIERIPVEEDINNVSKDQ